MEVVSKGTASADDGDGVFSISPNEEEDVRVQVSHTAAGEEELAAEIIILPDRKSHVSSDGDAARAFLDHPKSEVSSAKLWHRFKYCGNENDPEAADARGSLVSEGTAVTPLVKDTARHKWNAARWHAAIALSL